MDDIEGLAMLIRESEKPVPVTREGWIELHNSFKQSNRDYCTDCMTKSGRLIPSFVGITAKAGKIVVFSMMPNAASKNTTVAMVKMMALKERFFTLYHMDEVWTVKPQPNQTPEEFRALAAQYKGNYEHHPHRAELVMIGFESSVKAVHRFAPIEFAEISRDAEGKPHLGPWKDKHYTGLEGRFRNLLVDPPSPEYLGR